MNADEGGELAFEFGPFQLLPKQKLLLKRGSPLGLGGRAMDLLVELVQRAGELLSREELESRVWPTTIVEETSLRVHVSALRRALQDGLADARYITNVPGRGYCFVAAVTRTGNGIPAAPALKADATGISTAIPARLASMIGRDAVVATLVDQIPLGRMITVVGTGGIGKTTVALAVAERARLAHPALSVCFVDLSLVADGARVPAALAAAFGLVDFADDPVEAVLRLFGSHPILLVLDSCEHVVDAVAGLADTLLANAPGLRLLATSRELIGLNCEWACRLPALAVPSPQATTADVLASSSIQLFVERASANIDSFRLSEEDAPLAADLCRRLAGIPLAIEVATARLDQFGLRGLVSQLDEGFLHLRRNRRTGSSRHEALSATLDWSYRLLSPAEQKVLQRVAVFRSPFTLQSALRVAADGRLSESDVVNGLAGLRSKSLLHRVAFDDVVKHQLLDQTRVYALEKLACSGDEDAVRRRHAMRVATLLADAQRNWSILSKRQWISVHGTLLPAIHTALKWAFSPSGDSLVGVTLTAASWPMARYLFLEDYEAHIERAIEALEGMASPPLSLSIQLHLGLAAHVQERQGTGPASRAAYNRAAELARAAPEPIHQIEAQIGQILDAMGSADFARALGAAHRIKALAAASRDEVATVVADRLLAQALHMNGDHVQARQLALSVRSHAVQRGPLASLAGVVDHRVSMEILLARSLWLQGHPDQAAAAAVESMALAETDSALAVCQALALAACPVALWRGDNDRARHLAETLLAQAQKQGSGQWLSLAQGYLAIIEARTSPGDQAYRRPADAAANFPFVQDQMLSLAASQWHESSLERTARHGSGWCAPEIWRLQALRLWACGSVADAEAMLMKSMGLAQTQNAVAWSLRSATSLAALLQQERRLVEARAMLEPVYLQFKEGTGTIDLVDAARQMEALQAVEVVPLRTQGQRGRKSETITVSGQ